MVVHILGSCVSRDIFNLENISNELGSYTARTSLISQTSSPCSQLPINLNLIKSAFQRRMVEQDLKSSFFDRLSVSDGDILRIDLIDERFNLLRLTYPESFATLSNELASLRFPYQTYGEVISNKSEEYLCLWKKSWDIIVNKFKDLGILDKVFINKVYWASSLSEGNSPIPGLDLDTVEFYNSRLNKMYEYIARDINKNNFIEAPGEYFISTTNHRWGASPYHYDSPYYDFMSKELLNRIKPLTNGLIFYNPEQRHNLINSNFSNFTLSKYPTVFKVVNKSQKFSLDIHYTAPTQSVAREKSAIIYFELSNADWRNKSSVPLMYSENKNIRWFKYLNLEAGDKRVNVSFELPQNITVTAFAISTWATSSNDKITIHQIKLNN